MRFLKQTSVNEFKDTKTHKLSKSFPVLMQTNKVSLLIIYSHEFFNPTFLCDWNFFSYFSDGINTTTGMWEEVEFVF